MIDAKYEVNKTPAFGPGGERWVYEVSRIDITGNRVSLSYYGDQTTADNIVKLLQKSDAYGDDTALRESERKIYFRFGAICGALFAGGAIYLLPFYWNWLKPLIHGITA